MIKVLNGDNDEDVNVANITPTTLWMVNAFTRKVVGFESLMLVF